MTSGPSAVGPAAPPARVAAQARFELSTLLANGEQLLVSLVLPLGALLGLVLTTAVPLGSVAAQRRVDLAVPGVLALCVISAAFTAQAIATGFDRRYAVLRLLGTTPLGRDGLLWGKALGTVGVELIQWAVIGAVGLLLGWAPVWAGLAPALVLLLAGTWAFVALALLLAGTVRAEGVLALANLVWVALLVLGGVLVPPTQLPAPLGAVAAGLPSGALADGLRAAFVEGRLALGPLLVLVAWGSGGTVLAARLFRWSE